MRPRRYTPSEIEHVADVYVASGFNGQEAMRRLRQEERFRGFREGTLYGWIEENKHKFQGEIERAVTRARRREVVDPITATEAMIGAIQDRITTYRAHHDELVAEGDLKESSKISRDLIKLEEHLRNAYEFLHCLQNPKEGQAAQQAVVAFVQILINSATPMQREVIVAVAAKILPEKALE